MTTQKTPNRLSRSLRRSALSLALGLCVAGGAQAQTNTAGAIAGRASAGDSITITITITNPATGTGSEAHHQPAGSRPRSIRRARPASRSNTISDRIRKHGL
ncbi:MAG: hypothetical protein QM761_03380 [Pseudoxanthomonas sp.]